jgi:type IV pilus assembly protein PilQ
MRLILIIILASLVNVALAQQHSRIDSIRTQLDDLAKTETGLLEEVEISVSDLSITEFLSAIAQAHKLNVSVNGNINQVVTNDFSNARVIDVFVFVCKEYELDIEVIGNIISVVKFTPPKLPPKPVAAKKLSIEFNSANQFLSLDLKRDTLFRVAKEITEVSGINVILSPGLENEIVSSYIQNRPIKNTLEKLAFANGLELTKSTDNFFIISKKKLDPKTETANNTKKARGKPTQKSPQGLLVEIKDGHLTIDANNVPIKEIIEVVSEKLEKNYFLFSDPKGNATLYFENAGYNEFMSYLLNGTDYTHKYENNVYLFGKRQLDKLRTTEIFQMQNRTIESVLDVIPAEIKKGVEIKEFVELNSYVITGSYTDVREVTDFLESVDKIVPVVTIDVIIVNVSKNQGLSTGISAGFGENPDPGTGTAVPEINQDLDANKLLDIIGGILGPSTLNLGKVSSDFYLSIRALETDGILKTRSTPKLATINGHEANTTIGTTEYYLETSNSVVGTQNPQNIQTKVYKSVSADLSITIKPIVSGDEQVTLEIEVEQSDFTTKIEPGAPPGSVTRKFNSVIRVKNEEMILLGGLEEKSVSESGRGLPFLSKIPVIKWVFGRRDRNKSKTKLNIFIKPTILY